MPMPLRRTLLALGLCLTACAGQKPTPNPPPSAAAAQEEQPSAAASAPALRAVGMEDGFRVRIPGEPQVQRNSVSVRGGDVRTGAFNSSVDGTIYSVSFADYPEEMVKARPPEDFLNEGRNALANQLKGTVSDEQPLQLQGHPGKSYTVQSDNGTVRARSFMVGHRLYTLLVLFNPSIGAPEADAFLQSLELLQAP